ncbi:MAG: Na+/H+ antiporter subunit E [Desulfobulbaceae bacterium]|jgi:multicomponent K+:H+ antiporter subunit E|nr:Na+/H+ antiporter subunit E [Desulfobulbaceae bacterium]MDY0350425.1 Na+/H+ antiporter subunit E [Desulfobulbaceae bacterium]
MKRLLPQPLFSVFLWLVWLLLNNSAAPGHLLLGALLALALPLFTVRFRPDRPRLRKPLKLLGYIAVLLWDIVLANLTVARLILGPTGRLRPAFIRLPLELRNEFAVVVLANTLSLSPGTVSADLSPDRRTLLIHFLDVDDPKQAIAHIKQRYEKPLQEIFEC